MLNTLCSCGTYSFTTSSYLYKRNPFHSVEYCTMVISERRLNMLQVNGSFYVFERIPLVAYKATIISSFLSAHNFLAKSSAAFWSDDYSDNLCFCAHLLVVQFVNLGKFVLNLLVLCSATNSRFYNRTKFVLQPWALRCLSSSNIVFPAASCNMKYRNENLDFCDCSHLFARRAAFF